MKISLKESSTSGFFSVTFQKKKKSQLWKFARKPQDLSSDFLNSGCNHWDRPVFMLVKGRKSHWLFGYSIWNWMSGYLTHARWVSAHGPGGKPDRREFLAAGFPMRYKTLPSSQMLIFSTRRNLGAPKPATSAKISEQGLLHASDNHSFTVPQKDLAFPCHF